MVYVETRLTWLFMWDGRISSSAPVAGEKCWEPPKMGQAQERIDVDLGVDGVQLRDNIRADPKEPGE